MGEPGKPIRPEREYAEAENGYREPIKNVFAVAAQRNEGESSKSRHAGDAAEKNGIGHSCARKNGGKYVGARQNQREEKRRAVELPAPAVQSPEGERPDRAEIPDEILADPCEGRKA